MKTGIVCSRVVCAACSVPAGAEDGRQLATPARTGYDCQGSRRASHIIAFASSYELAVLSSQDEAHTLPNTLLAIKPFIDYYYILDTGSTGARTSPTAFSCAATPSQLIAYSCRWHARRHSPHARRCGRDSRGSHAPSCLFARVPLHFFDFRVSSQTLNI